MLSFLNTLSKVKTFTTHPILVHTLIISHVLSYHVRLCYEAAANVKELENEPESVISRTNRTETSSPMHKKPSASLPTSKPAWRI